MFRLKAWCLALLLGGRVSLRLIEQLVFIGPVPGCGVGHWQAGPRFVQDALRERDADLHADFASLDL